ncbi:MAG: cob(I)yrinic acid a,c-diamide adenosyltransferase [Patescibacteria group bacterium]
MLQCYTGNGKGKTTAALGLVMRAIGAGKRVAWVAFDKGGEDHYSERKTILERFPDMEFYPTGLDRIDPQTKKFRFGVTDLDRLEGERALEIVKGLLNEARHDLVILDEINSSVSLGIADELRALELLQNRKPEIEIVLTGRDAPKSFLDMADLITDMTLVEHYFYHGTQAREGYDF